MFKKTSYPQVNEEIFCAWKNAYTRRSHIMGQIQRTPECWLVDKWDSQNGAMFPYQTIVKFHATPYKKVKRIKMSFPDTSTHNQRINLISKFAKNANVALSSCVLSAVFCEETILTLRIVLWHYAISFWEVSLCLCCQSFSWVVHTANWGIIYHRFHQKRGTRNSRPWFVFPDRPALIIASLAHIDSTTLPWRGGRLGHHCQPSQESRKLRDMKILICAIGSINSLYWEWKHIPPLVEILIIGILTPLQNWVDEFIPYGNYGSGSNRSHIYLL